MDKYFDHMTKIAPQQDLKIRFALMDVIELRQVSSFLSYNYISVFGT